MEVAGAALRLALDYHKEISNQAANGVSVLAVKNNREGQCKLRNEIFLSLKFRLSWRICFYI
jgi:hypothetical protein